MDNRTRAQEWQRLGEMDLSCADLIQWIEEVNKPGLKNIVLALYKVAAISC